MFVGRFMAFLEEGPWAVRLPNVETHLGIAAPSRKFYGGPHGAVEVYCIASEVVACP